MSPRQPRRGASGPTTLTFLGAAGNVTGSRFLLEVNGYRLLIDCGLYQEREYASRNWDPFAVDPASIDAVLLTHAHLDHTGYFPRLVRDGFRGPAWCTPATADLAEILFNDAARINVEDARFKKRRHRREGRRGPHPEVPLYTTVDARRAIGLLRSVEYHRSWEVVPGVRAEFRDAGHILGSSSITLRVPGAEGERTITFSGDIGRSHQPPLLDPEPLVDSDYVVVESTYGDRQHEDGDPTAQLEEIVNSTVEAGGNIVIPAFAIGRTQDVLLNLKRLTEERRIPRLLTFLDSPMATSVTGLYRRHQHLLDPEFANEFRSRHSPFDFPGLDFVRSVEASKAINHLGGSAVIIAGAGMCNGGRIKHHLVSNIGRPESTIAFVGYQARGTLGRRIVDGDDPVRILGHQRDVRARIANVRGFSAHADQEGLQRWLESGTRPGQVFVVHGEAEASRTFADLVSARGLEVTVPTFEQRIEIR
ncbi:MAG: MBL fold metallo-hydrolase [Dehalococcoidia bacterium]